MAEKTNQDELPIRREIPSIDYRLDNRSEFGPSVTFTCPDCHTEIVLTQFYQSSKTCACHFWWQFSIRVQGVRVQ